MYLSNYMILTNMMTVYSTLRIAFTLLAVVLFIVLVVYGYIIRIDTILSKKLGIRKKREIALMKAGKVLQRKRVSQVLREQQTEQIQMGKALEDENGTIRLEQTELLQQHSDESATMVLKPKEEFYLTKNVIVVHGNPLR